jgi:hypothetical protein
MAQPASHRDPLPAAVYSMTTTLVQRGLNPAIEQSRLISAFPIEGACLV